MSECINRCGKADGFDGEPIMRTEECTGKLNLQIFDYNLVRYLGFPEFCYERGYKLEFWGWIFEFHSLLFSNYVSPLSLNLLFYKNVSYWRSCCRMCVTINDFNEYVVSTNTYFKRNCLGVGIVGQQNKPLPGMLASHMGTSSCLTCSSSNPAPC